MLKLHHLDRSPFNWKVRFALAEKGVPHELTVPTDKANDPAFARLNPLKLTPVLELGDGRVLYESTIICEYLEDAYPNPPLLPKDPWERARVRLLEDTADQYLYPTQRAYLTAQFDIAPPVLKRKPASSVDPKQVAETRAKLEEHLARYEAALGTRQWFGGDSLSLADIGLAPPLTGSLKLLGLLPDTSRYPSLSAWMSRISARPAYVASAPKEPWRIEG